MPSVMLYILNLSYSGKYDFLLYATVMMSD